MPGTIDRLQGGNKFDAVFTDKKDNSTLSQSDFLKLMVAQMQNQDFTNPMDNTQMVNQMVQFSNMQMMQEMAGYSKTGYAMSLVGKNVTASRFTVSGDLDTTTGPVEKVSLVDGQYIIYVGGKKYELSQIMEVQSADQKSKIDASKYLIEASEIKSDSVTITWKVPTEDQQQASGLTYSVYYSKRGPFNTVEEVEKNGVLIGQKNQKNMTKETVTGLDADTRYYINVVVTDANGNKSIYQPVNMKTTKS